MNEIKLIYASTLSGVIGNKGKLPWNVPEDLKFFKEKTLGRTVLMGRKTYMSLPEKFRPLPGRTNVVASRQEGLVIPGVQVVNDPVAFVKEATGTVWVAGGAELYKQLYPYCTEILHTQIHSDARGDEIFVFDKDKWLMTYDSGLNVSITGTVYTIKRYRLSLA